MDLLSRMERDWDCRAREAPEYYVANARTDWSPEEFLRSGEINVDNDILADPELIHLPCEFGQMRVLEIGCGAGRMTRAIAAAFGQVDAVDISAEMIALARRNLDGIRNAAVQKNNGTDLAPLPDGVYDFAFSFIVFQHIPSTDVIRSYVREVHRCLTPGGLFKFQVQGDTEMRPPADDTWIGEAMSLEDARALAEETGFELVRAAGEGTQYFWLWFRKGGGAWARPVMGSVEIVLPESVRAGDRYHVRIPAFQNQMIDIAYALESGEAGVVVRWCTLDGHGCAWIPVPINHQPALVRITHVRSRTGRGRWLPASAAIRVL
jgi:SAM-dependent methyltransferase